MRDRGLVALEIVSFAPVPPVAGAGAGTVTVRHAAVGPGGSRVAVEPPGTIDGGFFDTRSAHPLDDPLLSSFPVPQSRRSASRPGRRGALRTICRSLRPC